MLPTLFFSSRAARSLGRLAGNQCRKLRSSRSNPPVTTQNGRFVFSAWRGFHASSMFRDSDSKTGHVWSEEWKNVKLGAKRPSEHSEVDMKQVLFIETGFGCDQHGDRAGVGATKAAVRACRNAIEFNSIPCIADLVPGGRPEMKIRIRLGVPQDCGEVNSHCVSAHCRTVSSKSMHRAASQHAGQAGRAKTGWMEICCHGSDARGTLAGGPRCRLRGVSLRKDPPNRGCSRRFDLPKRAGCDGAWRQGRHFRHRCRVYHRRALANAAISKLISYKKVCNECKIGLLSRAVAVPKQKDPRLAAEAEQDTGYLTAAAVEYRQRSTFPSAFQAPTSQSDHPASYV